MFIVITDYICPSFVGYRDDKVPVPYIFGTNIERVNLQKDQFKSKIEISFQKTNVRRKYQFGVINYQPV